MPSPITHEDFQPTSWGGPACEKFKELMLSNDRFGTFLEWLLGSDGELSDEALQGIYNRMMPIGAMIMWASATTPSDKWLICLGQEVSRTEYQQLFQRIGTTFGSGDGATTFNLPNFQNRSPIGAGGLYQAGQEIGERAVEIVAGNLPAHTHSITTRKVDSIAFYDSSQGRLEVINVYGNGSNTEIADGGIQAGSPSTSSVETLEEGEAEPDSIDVVHPSLGVHILIKAL